MQYSKRNTIQRQAIFESLRELNIHATAEEVYEHVAKRYNTISKATVYRNLAQMAEDKEILNIGNICGSAHYDHNCHEHYHFVCEKCQKIFDINTYFPNISKQVAETNDFEITGHTLIFSGLCQSCK